MPPRALEQVGRSLENVWLPSPFESLGADVAAPYDAALITTLREELIRQLETLINGSLSSRPVKLSLDPSPVAVL